MYSITDHLRSLIGRPDDGRGTVISSLTGEYLWLSNLYPMTRPITVTDDHGELVSGPSAEHLYQALKTDDPAQRARVLAAPTPLLARYAGGKVERRADWGQIKDLIMALILAAKFGPAHPELRRRLIATGQSRIDHITDDPENYWSIDRGTGKGRGRLGELLIGRRTALHRQQAQAAGPLGLGPVAEFVVGSARSTARIGRSLWPRFL